MTAPTLAATVAARINEVALRGGWSWTGWVAAWRHGLLGRDVLPAEPLTLFVPTVDLDDAAEIATATLALDGWTTTHVPTGALDRLLAVTAPGTNAAVILLRGCEPPLDIVHVAGWPCTPVGDLAVDAAVRILLGRPAGHIMRRAAALDLLTTTRALSDSQLLAMLDGLPARSRGELAEALRDVPNWLLAASTARARELTASRRRLLHTLDDEAPVRAVGGVSSPGTDGEVIVVDDLLVATLLGRRRVRLDDTRLLARLVEWAVWERRPELLGQLTAAELAAVWPSLTLSVAERDGLVALASRAATTALPRRRDGEPPRPARVGPGCAGAGRSFERC